MKRDIRKILKIKAVQNETFNGNKKAVKPSTWNDRPQHAKTERINGF
jgi:hypothetical protein